jgi:DNA-binding NtrC family response regulator
MKRNILLVEDEVNILKVLSTALTKEKFNVETAMTGEDALVMMKGKKFDLILSDYKLPGMNGETLLEKVKSSETSLPVILITAYGTINLAVNAMKKGAYTFLTKPVNLNVLLSTVRDAIRLKNQDFDDEISGHYQFMNIIGKTKPMQEIYSMIHRVSKTDASVLILGESGTGKELVARAIHYTSLRSDNPFIPIDCTTIPAELMESELFGYEKGAFTCAYNNKIGLIEMAKGGTVFFEKINADVRVLAATNRNIEEAVEKGDFREDLYYRLNVISMSMPSLRERKEDISLLASHFLEEAIRRNKKEILGFEQNVLDILKSYEWPGNVRELENIVERSVILCSYDQINVECLPRKLTLLDYEELPDTEDLNLFEIEKKIIYKALDKTAWNQSQAAILLGISRKQLRTKMKNLGLSHE